LQLAGGERIKVALIWLPAGVGAYLALRRVYPGAMLLAMQWAALAAISMMLGLMRWPTAQVARASK